MTCPCNIIVKTLPNRNPFYASKSQIFFWTKVFFFRLQEIQFLVSIPPTKMDGCICKSVAGGRLNNHVKLISLKAASAKANTFQAFNVKPFTTQCWRGERFSILGRSGKRGWVEGRRCMHAMELNLLLCCILILFKKNIDFKNISIFLPLPPLLARSARPVCPLTNSM